MTMTLYDQTPTDDTPTIHAWDPTGPNMGDGAWREVTDPAEIASFDAALTAGAVGDVYVAYDPAYEVWVAPAGVAAPAPDGWTSDDGSMHDPPLPPPDLHLSSASEVWGEPGVTDLEIALDRGIADPLAIDAALFDPL